MSATMDMELLKGYFNAPAYHIPGRLHPVEVSFIWRFVSNLLPFQIFYCENSNFSAPNDEHVEDAVRAVIQLHESEPIE
jgi:HrpA-like RNA helicase